MPGLAAVIEAVVAFEDAVREPIFSRMHGQPSSPGVRAGARGRKRQEWDMAGPFASRGGGPSGRIKHQDGLGAGFAGAVELGEMGVPRLGGGGGPDEAGGLTRGRAEGAEARACSHSCG